MQSIHGEAMKGCGKEAQTQVAIHAPKGPLIYYEFDDGLGWSWASENRKTHYNLIVKKRVERCGGKYTAIRSRRMCFMFIFTALQNELCASRVTLAALGSDEATNGAERGDE